MSCAVVLEEIRDLYVSCYSISRKHESQQNPMLADKLLTL